MATTGAVIQLLASGVINTSTGAALASGKARFYQPNTLVAQNVYSDDTCSTAITQPYTLGSGGEAKLFMLDPVRMIVKDSSDTTTHLDCVIVQRHDQQYVTHASYNGGAETTLEALLTTFATSLGTNLQYKESSSATARNYQAWMANTYVSVLDFAADSTGTNDSATAFTNAINEAIDNGCKRVYVDPGTYRIDSVITAIDTAGLEIFGAGRGRSVIRNHSTSANVFTIATGAAADSKLYIHDLTITANTTSSGAAISFTSGDRSVIERVSTLLHRTGLSASAVTATCFRNCVVESTDDNASAVGIAAGARGRVDDCEVISGTDNGSGIVLGADGRAVNCYVSNFATAYLLSGARSRAYGCHAAGPTTGYSLTGADAIVEQCYLDTATTGISLGAARTAALNNRVETTTTGITVGAFSDCQVIGNHGATNTTGISINASATNLIEHSNRTMTPLSDSALTPHDWLGLRAKTWRTTKGTDANATPTFTPTPNTCDHYVCESTYAAANTTVTVAATSTTGLTDGQLLAITIYKNGANALTSVTWNAQYKAAPNTPANIVDGSWETWWFRWKASTSFWNFLLYNASFTGATAGTTYW